MAGPNDYQMPGQLIRALLDERGWTQKVLATVLHASAQYVTQLVNGKTDVTPERALQLEEVFGVDAEDFMDLQKRYELARARMLLPNPDTGLARRAALYTAYPVAEMIKRRWIDADDIKQTDAIEKGLTQLFGGDPAQILPHAAKKAGQEDAPATPVQQAWLARVRQLARAMLAPRYSQLGLRSAVRHLRTLLTDPSDARHVPRALLDCGVRFVVVEPLPGAKIDGVCTWIDDAPVIGMSLRLDRIDNFWFVLRHEIEHALREHGREKEAVDAELDRENGGTGAAICEQERQANAAALDFCVPKADMDDFFLRKRPFFYDKDIVNFARRIKVHPGLVAGQLRHRLNRWDLYQAHLAPLRSVILPVARIDGWGSVATITA